MKHVECYTKPASPDSGTNKNTTKVQELMYELKVRDAMTQNVISVTPHTPMAELREIMRINKISGTPVLNNDEMVGIITVEDLIKWLVIGPYDSTVENMMTKKVESVCSDEPLVHAVNKLGLFGFGRFPVIERETKKLVGIITYGDVVKGILKKMEVAWQDEELHKYRASHIFDDLIADEASLSLQYNIEGGDMKRAGEASSHFKKTLTRLGIDPASMRRTAISCYEAEMNMIIYSNGGKMNVKIEPGIISVEAKDSGPGIPDIKKAMEPGFSTAPDWVRDMGFGAGMGLNNIQNNADHMELASTVGKGTTLKFVINYKPRTEAK